MNGIATYVVFIDPRTNLLKIKQMDSTNLIMLFRTGFRDPIKQIHPSAVLAVCPTRERARALVNMLDAAGGMAS